MYKKYNHVYWIGIALLFIAVFYLLDMFGIDFKNFVILSIGIFSMQFAYKSEITFCKYASLFIISTGVIRIIFELIPFNTINLINYCFLWMLVYILGCLIISKKRIFIVIFFTVLTATVIGFVSEMKINTNTKYAYYLFSLTILSVIYFILKSKTLNYSFLLLPILMYLFATNNMLIGKGFINIGLYKLINLLLLVLSAFSVIITSKKKTIEEDNSEQ